MLENLVQSRNQEITFFVVHLMIKFYFIFDAIWCGKSAIANKKS